MIYPIALTIKPTLNCNMRCRHCFNGHSLEQTAICDSKTACTFIDLAAKSYSTIKITFHGGEPTLAGFRYYQEVFSHIHKLQKNGIHFHFFFTTNAILLSGKLLQLLKENDVMFNVSFDGPFNDVLRGRTKDVYDTIIKLQQIKARFRIFCSICNPSYKKLKETYQWFNERKIDFKIFPIDPYGFAKENEDLLMDMVDFLYYLGIAYRYWILDKYCQIKVGTFHEFAALRRKEQFKPYWFNREIALNPDGLIYPFGRPNDCNFPLGKPGEVSSLEECFSNPNYSKMKENIEKLWNEFCIPCPSNKVCHGVCMAMKYMYTSNKVDIRSSCNISNGIFQTILSINEAVKQKYSYNDLNPYAAKLLFKEA